MKPYIRRVQYYETDMMGIVHHANYIHWMEEARIDFMDQLGYSYEQLEDQGVFSPVRSLSCEYKHPCTFHDVIHISVSIAGFNGARLYLRYEMKKADSEEVICNATSEHAFMDQKGRVLRLKRAVPELSQKIELLCENNERAPYRFFGWEYASPEILKLYDDLKHVWCEETCSLKMRSKWSEKNLTLGQCTITSFLIQDLFGGKVYGIPLDEGGVHCYNVIDGKTFDLTSEQFGDRVLCYEHNHEQSREDQFSDQEKKERYELLKKKLLEYRCSGKQE